MFKRRLNRKFIQKLRMRLGNIIFLCSLIMMIAECKRKLLKADNWNKIKLTKNDIFMLLLIVIEILKVQKKKKGMRTRPASQYWRRMYRRASEKFDPCLSSIMLRWMKSRIIDLNWEKQKMNCGASNLIRINR